jgi:DNA-binding IclR family transcriptional regulator
MTLIEAERCLHFRDLARRSGLPTGTLAHHLSVLQRSGLIDQAAARGLRLVFVPSLGPTAAVRTWVLRKDGLAELYAYVARSGPVAQRAVLDAFAALPRSTVQHRLHQLVRGGCITTREQGRFVHYAAVPG